EQFEGGRAVRFAGGGGARLGGVGGGAGRRPLSHGAGQRFQGPARRAQGVPGRRGVRRLQAERGPGNLRDARDGRGHAPLPPRPAPAGKRLGQRADRAHRGRSLGLRVRRRRRRRL
ncbi:MAG: hypothetical protein AVDCRST_MAG89-2832, partial [uncultured Gemmatimonadetes bacterium]